MNLQHPIWTVEDIPHEWAAKLFRHGRILAGLVLHDLGNDQYIVRISRFNLLVKSRVPLKQGESVSLQVRAEQPRLELKLLKAGKKSSSGRPLSPGRRGRDFSRTVILTVSHTMDNQLAIQISYFPNLDKSAGPVPIERIVLHVRLNRVPPVQIEIRQKEDGTAVDFDGISSTFLNYLKQNFQHHHRYFDEPECSEGLNVSIMQLMTDVDNLRRLFDMQNRDPNGENPVVLSDAMKETVLQLEQACTIPANLMRTLGRVLAFLYYIIWPICREYEIECLISL